MRRRASSAGSTAASPRTAKGYEGWVGNLIRSSGRALVAFVLLIGLVALLFTRMPNSFLPNEDQGYVIANIQLPPGATLNAPTQSCAREDFIMKQPEMANMVSVLGFSFSGAGQNMALAFIPLKDWSERKGAARTRVVANRIIGGLTGAARRLHLRAVAPADSRTGPRHRLLVPPAGPWRQRPRRPAGGA